MKESNSSTDSGNGSAFGLTGSDVAGTVGGKGAATGAEEGDAPLDFGGSIVADAMSSSLEVAASSL